jgi:hypothetical protein
MPFSGTVDSSLDKINGSAALSDSVAGDSDRSVQFGLRCWPGLGKMRCSESQAKMRADYFRSVNNYSMDHANLAYAVDESPLAQK